MADQTATVWEKQRLAETIALAKSQLEQAKLDNQDNSAEIAELRQEMRENAVHSGGNLWSSQDFEDLVELAQYTNPILKKEADIETVSRRIEVLEQLIESPYFARIDFKFADRDNFAPVYIGRATLTDPETYEMAIYDWRSPIASVFYRFGMGPAFYEAPVGKISGEVNLKRQYEIKKGHLDYFFDADVQIIDDFLRKLLSQNTSAKMKTIVETIQKEQDLIIRDMENDLMMVQGVAGSGKTSIALHRVAYLMYQGLSAKLYANVIIIISPNSLFEQYIINVLPELGESNVVSVVFEDILAAVLQTKRLKSRYQFLEALMAKPRQKDLIKSCIEFKTSPEFIAILDRWLADLPNHGLEFNAVYFEGALVVSPAELRNQVLKLSPATPLGSKLKLLETFICDLADTRLELGRNRNSVHSAIKKELSFTELSIDTIKGLYQNLVSDQAYFGSLAQGLPLPDCLSEILALTQDNLASEDLYYDDALVLAFLQLKINGSNQYKNIKQVVIDEAQDYYYLHYEILKLLFTKSKYTILGDINQTLKKQEDLSFYQSISQILAKPKSSLAIMDKSFRSTNQILAYSAKFIPAAQSIKSFNRNGDDPQVRQADNLAELQQLITAEVEDCLAKGYKAIGLICKTEKNAQSLFAGLKDQMDVKLIKNNSAADLGSTLIIPVYMSKGLEFDAVLICDADADNYYSEDDQKLLYIACTRALHRLNLFCQGQPSPLL